MNEQNESRRFDRMMMIKGMDDTAMNRLKQARVLVVGSGALGSMCSMQLAASGVGYIGIADFDTVDISNLHRQIFFDMESLGKLKCDILAKRMIANNPNVWVEKFPLRIDQESAAEIFGDFDFVIDGSDNPTTKYMTSVSCQKMSIPYCIGGIREMSGQVMSWSPGHLGYTDIFGDIRQCAQRPECKPAGVLGSAPAMVASIQVAEAIKYFTGIGEMLYDRLFMFDLKTLKTQILNFK